MQYVNETLQDLVFGGNWVDIYLKLFIAEPGLKSSFTGNDVDLSTKPTVPVIQPGNVINMDVRRCGTHTRKDYHTSLRHLRIRGKKPSSLRSHFQTFACSRTDPLQTTECLPSKGCSLTNGPGHQFPLIPLALCDVLFVSWYRSIVTECWGKFV